MRALQGTYQNLRREEYKCLVPVAAVTGGITAATASTRTIVFGYALPPPDDVNRCFSCGAFECAHYDDCRKQRPKDRITR